MRKLGWNPHGKVTQSWAPEVWNLVNLTIDIRVGFKAISAKAIEGWVPKRIPQSLPHSYKKHCRMRGTNEQLFREVAVHTQTSHVVPGTSVRKAELSWHGCSTHGLWHFQVNHKMINGWCFILLVAKWSVTNMKIHHREPAHPRLARYTVATKYAVAFSLCK